MGGDVTFDLALMQLDVLTEGWVNFSLSQGPEALLKFKKKKASFRRTFCTGGHQSLIMNFRQFCLTLIYVNSLRSIIHKGYCMSDKNSLGLCIF